MLFLQVGVRCWQHVRTGKRLDAGKVFLETEWSRMLAVCLWKQGGVGCWQRACGNRRKG